MKQLLKSSCKESQENSEASMRFNPMTSPIHVMLYQLNYEALLVVGQE